jgi:hypothetical protein
LFYYKTRITDCHGHNLRHSQTGKTPELRGPGAGSSPREGAFRVVSGWREDSIFPENRRFFGNKSIYRSSGFNRPAKRGLADQLSGWIRTRGVERFARLELTAYEYTPGNHTASAESAPVCGNRDWTRVSLELNSGDSVYVLPKLLLYGPGAAWFDDLTLELIP